MTRGKILLLIPLAIITGLIVYTWTVVLFTDSAPVWRHYTATVFLFVLIFLFFKDFKKTVIGTGIYLIIGTCNLSALTPSVMTNSYGIRIGTTEIWTPSFQLLPFGLLLFFFILNFDALTNIYLDYKDTKQNKKGK